MSQIQKIIKYNLAQLAFMAAVLYSNAKIFILEWGRGTGKSTIIGKHLYDCVVEMPRSTGGLVGATYAQIKTRTLPSTIAGLEQHGIYKDKHYFIGRRPPKEWGWPEAYQAVLDPTNCIFWWNGSVTVFISLDGGASSGRGLNLDYAIGDEAALFDKDKFSTDVDLTIRGNLYQKAFYPDGSWKFFKDCRRHHSLLLATSTPLTSEGMWVLDYEKIAKEKPDEVKFIRASAVLNIINLGKKFFQRCKASMPDFMYMAEVLNKRITQIKDGFYPKLDERRHSYNAFNNEYYRELQLGTAVTCAGDSDLSPDMPLHLAIDWGANINCLLIAQQHTSEIRILKNMYVLAPNIFDDLIEKQFLPYYAPHTRKEIFLWYDATGNVNQANSRKTYAQQVIDIFKRNGWKVTPMTRAMVNESHEVKYRLWSEILMENNPRMPVFRINRHNCPELLISMKSAPAMKGTKSAIQKNKSSERNKKIPQQHATHFSDTADILIVGLFRRLLNAAAHQGFEARIIGK